MAPSEGFKKSCIVLYTSPGIGHLTSTVELAKVLLGRGLPVTVALLVPPCGAGFTAAFIDRLAKSLPEIPFHRIPAADLPPSDNPENLSFEQIQRSNANLRIFLDSISATALVLDFFCASAVQVAADLGIPVFCFIISGACGLAALIHLPVIDKTTTQSFKDLGETPIRFPCLPSIPASHMAVPLLDRKGDGYAGFLRIATCLLESDGIIVNSFEALEPAVLEAIRSGVYAPDGVPTPPIYCVGPLISSDDEAVARADCLSWLDSQPPASVVFLNFGSLGRFSSGQLREMANGLEASGQRFLWVVRSPDGDDEPDIKSLLPAGFLDRTRQRGMAVKSWAPQKSVLAHKSVGGFVTHLGWNSVLEGISAGVPMVGWPLYAEQRMNKVFLDDGLGLLSVMEGYDKGFVTSAEVEARIRWLMESDGGRALRNKTAAAKEAAAAGMRKNGSSLMALEELVRLLSVGI